MIEFVDPRAEPGAPVEPYTLGLSDTDGPLTVGLLANGFPDSVAFLDHVEKSLAATLPAAIVERGTTPEQRVLVATVGDLPARARAAEFGAPALIILGEVVRLREKLAWFETANPAGDA